MKFLRVTNLTVAASLLIISLTSPVEASTIARCADHVPDSYIVLLDPATLPVPTDGRLPRKAVANEALKLQQQYGGRISHVYESTVHGFSLHDLSDQDAQSLARDPRVKHIEENCIFHPSASQSNPPNWGLDRIDERYLPMDGLYTYNRTAWNVHVYVLDYFIHYHADFEGRVRDRTDCMGNEGKDDANTWSCEHPADHNGTPADTHATGVAGVIGSETYGVAKQVNLHSLKVCAWYGCAAENVIAAINWIRDNHTDPALLHMSINYEPCKNDESPTQIESFGVRNALEAAINDNITVVVSAGNCGIDACYAPPANTPAAIVVGATDTSDSRSLWPSYSRASNYGGCVDLFAPGAPLVSTSFDAYGNDASDVYPLGTSFSAPHATGLAALYLLTNPSATPAQVEQFLVDWSTKNVVSDPKGSPNRLLFSPYGNQSN